MTQENSKLSKAIDDAIIHALSESDGLTLLSKHFIEHFKESGFTIISTVPSDADVERVAVAIRKKQPFRTRRNLVLLKDFVANETELAEARAAIAAYVGAE